MKKLALICIFFILFHNISIAESYKLSAYAYVNGLVCDFCARSLEKTIGKQDKVESINIDLKDKLITINFYENQKLEENIITQLINDSGYTVREIKYEKKNNQSIWLLTFFPSISLFTSFATLLCCALPALLVTLGMGASLAGLIGTFPSITLLSNYKEYIFIISGILISFGFLSQLNSKKLSMSS